MVSAKLGLRSRCAQPERGFTREQYIQRRLAAALDVAGVFGGRGRPATKQSLAEGGQATGGPVGHWPAAADATKRSVGKARSERRYR